jgi:hypothetical protein
MKRNPPSKTKKPDASSKQSHPAAMALLAGLMQGQGERYGDQNMIEQGKRLGDAAVAQDALRRAKLTKDELAEEDRLRALSHRRLFGD